MLVFILLVHSSKWPVSVNLAMKSFIAKEEIKK
jgi:hypothetical protein